MDLATHLTAPQLSRAGSTVLQMVRTRGDVVNGVAHVEDRVVVGMRVSGPTVSGTVGSGSAAIGATSLSLAAAMSSAPVVGMQVTGHVGIPAGTTVKAGSTATQIDLAFSGPSTGLTVLVPASTIITCSSILEGTTVTRVTETAITLSRPTEADIPGGTQLRFRGATIRLSGPGVWPADLDSTELVFDPLVNEVKLAEANHLILPGQPVSGVGVPPGTTVVSYDESIPSITLSHNLTAGVNYTMTPDNLNEGQRHHREFEVVFDPMEMSVALGAPNTLIAAGQVVQGEGIANDTEVVSYSKGGAASAFTQTTTAVTVPIGSTTVELLSSTGVLLHQAIGGVSREGLKGASRAAGLLGPRCLDQPHQTSSRTDLPRPST